MTTLIEQLLSNSTNGKKELLRQELIVSVTEQIWAALEASGMTKADLARVLETSKANVTQLLSGQRNMTLSTLADIAAAINLKPCVFLAAQDTFAILEGGNVREVRGMRIVGPREAITSQTSSSAYVFAETPRYSKTVKVSSVGCPATIG